MRYLTGFALGEGEEKVAGHSGPVPRRPRRACASSPTRATRSRRAARRPRRGSSRSYSDLPARWPELLGVGRGAPGRGRGGVRLARRCGSGWRRPRRTSSSSRSRAGSRPTRAVKEPAELERIAAACAVADRALATLLPEIRPGVTERDLALRLEWLMRTGGAEALAFDVACLAGPEAALPHGSPGDRPVLDGAVLLFDFGAQVAGYRSDMTRTLFVGEPAERDLEIYELVARAQRAAIERARGVGRGAAARPLPTGRSTRRGRRATSSTAAGHGEHFGHGTGPRHRPRDPRAAVARPHRAPTRRCRARRSSRSSPASTSRARPASGSRTSSSSMPRPHRVERLTRFPRDVVVARPG